MEDRAVAAPDEALRRAGQPRHRRACGARRRLDTGGPRRPSSRSARRNAIDLVVVGPEAPLVAGLADDLAAAGITASGRAARRRGWKAPRATPRTSATRPGFPTARLPPLHRRRRGAAPMCGAKGAPIVVKADGLAAGKGVTVAATVDEALTAIDDLLRRRARRRRRRGGDRGMPHRRGGEFLRAHRRRRRPAAGDGAGPQARARRRHRPEHRRHGRLFAGAGDDRRRWSSERWRRSSGRRSPRWRGAARRSAASSMPG